MASITDVNLNEPVNAAKAQYQKSQDFLGGQNNQINDFTNKFSSFVNNLPTTQSMAESFGQRLNIPTLQNNANQIQSTIANLPHTYSQAVRGTDTNANQLQRIIASKLGELGPAATTANNALSSAQTNLSNQLGYAQNDISRSLLPIQNQAQLFGQNLASGAQLFGQNEQGELSSLISKMQTGAQLTEGELNRANALAIAKENNQAQMDQIQKQAELSGNANQYMSIGEGNTLIDTRTGQPVYTAPKTYASGAGGGFSPTLNNGQNGSSSATGYNSNYGTAVNPANNGLLQRIQSSQNNEWSL